MLFQSMYSWPRPHVQVDLHAIVQLWQAMHLFVSMIMQNCFSGPGASYGYSRSRPSCQLETWAMSLCLLHVGAGEVGGERRRGPLRAEAERERAPEPLASETAVLGLHDLGEGLLRRARGRVDVGLEPGPDHVAEVVLAHHRVGHLRGAEIRARAGLVAAVAEERDVVRLGALRRRTRPCGLSLDCPRPGRLHVEPDADHPRWHAGVDADAHHHPR